MTADTRYFIGLMSGTSLDAIDAALIRTTDSEFELVDCYAHTIDSELKSRIRALFLPGENEIDSLGELDRELAILSANSVQTLLKNNALNAEDICAIGSHGQTIRHRPATSSAHYGFSLQISDPNTIASETGITTVADFRRKDVALGGQGAPLAPAFHQYLARHETKRCGVLNIGGIANLSLIAPAPSSSVTGFDTGPGNALMDEWIQQHKEQPFDKDGQWAATGSPCARLLAEMLDDPYFKAPAPKSTGKEYFNSQWLNTFLSHRQYAETTPEAIQATLLELTAQTIRSACFCLNEHHPEIVYLCGGGALNKTLIKRLAELLPNISLKSSAELGISPMWIEASAFAWLAKQTIDRITTNCMHVTGARRNAILGGIYLP